MIDKQEKKSTKLYEDVVGCKWSRQILFLIEEGVNRPGAITRAVEGLTTKVQTDCLKRMVSMGILKRKDYPETPPRVEYSLSETGNKLLGILRQIEELEYDIGNQA